MPNNLLEDYPLKQITFPTEHTNGARYPSIFLVGSPAWADELTTLLIDENVFLISATVLSLLPDVNLFRGIDWANRQRLRADSVMFWYQPDTPIHIIFYQLTKAFVKTKKLFVGVHPNCQNRILIQTLANHIDPSLVIADSIASLANQVKTWLKTYENLNDARETHKS